MIILIKMSTQVWKFKFLHQKFKLCPKKISPPKLKDRIFSSSLMNTVLDDDDYIEGKMMKKITLLFRKKRRKNMKENVERKIEIHFTGECQQESFSRFSSDNVTSHLSTQKKLHTEHSMKKINKKGKIDNFHVFYRTKKKERKKGKKKKNYTCMRKKKRGEASKKNQSFHFSLFYGTKKNSISFGRILWK